MLFIATKLVYGSLPGDACLMVVYCQNTGLRLFIIRMLVCGCSLL